MKIFTVHEPRPRKDGASDTSRFVFVRDGFYVWAFLLGPLWMLVRRLWLVLLFYAVVMVAVQVGLTALGVSSTVKFTVGFLIALLIGFEASTLRRWTYARRRWRLHGVVVADDVESAERRFFDGYVPRTQASEPDVPPFSPALRAPPPATDVIGLFPEPEPRPKS
jgi:Protein of unknown function (DUF2628)